MRGDTHAYSITYANADADTYADADADFGLARDTVSSFRAHADLDPETVCSFLPNSSAYASATDADAHADTNSQPDCGSDSHATTVLPDIVGGRSPRRADRAGHHAQPFIISCTVRQLRH